MKDHGILEMKFEMIPKIKIEKTPVFFNILHIILE